MGRAAVSPTLRALLTGLIDYAGLFPPASLGMADAVARYARYRQGPHAWMLGSFILPRTRLDELSPTEQGWRLSVLASDDLAADAAAIAAFNQANHGACIDAVEAKVATADDVRRLAAALPPTLQLWCELAPGHAALDAAAGGQALDASAVTSEGAEAEPRTGGSVLDAIAVLGRRAGAKLRTGGTTADAIPAADAVARFLLGCARRGVRCKATAGLHHPLRALQRLTYAADSPTAAMHGFVNVFLAAAIAYDGVSRQVPDAEILARLGALLDESDAASVVWHDDHVVWRGHRVERTAIAAARAELAVSFGSCSFEEPVEDLQHLGWL